MKYIILLPFWLKHHYVAIYMIYMYRLNSNLLLNDDESHHYI